ncbi:SGNH hydrolase-type esterase domain-containing protein [Trichoderma evansii]
MSISALWARSTLLSSYQPLRIYTGTVRSSSTESSPLLREGDSHHPIASSNCITKSTTLRLMPLGGSITYGVGSSDKNGYRKFLYDMLTSDGYIVEMVGSRKSGTMANNQNEGWRGFTIDQIERKARISIPLLMPNLVTINAGSNDCLQDLEIGQIGNRVSGLVEYIWSTCPGATVILSTLLLNSDIFTEQRILQANAQFQELALQKHKQHKRIILVDMHGADGPNADELVDGTHPNDSAYQKMARIWHKGIRKAVSKGFLQA